MKWVKRKALTRKPKTIDEMEIEKEEKAWQYQLFVLPASDYRLGSFRRTPFRPIRRNAFLRGSERSSPRSRERWRPPQVPIPVSNPLAEMKPVWTDSRGVGPRGRRLTL